MHQPLGLKLLVCIDYEHSKMRCIAQVSSSLKRLEACETCHQIQHGCKNTEDNAQVRNPNLTLMSHVMYKEDTFTAQRACKALMSKTLQEPHFDIDVTCNVQGGHIHCTMSMQSIVVKKTLQEGTRVGLHKSVAQM